VEAQLYVTAYAPSAAQAYLAIDNVITRIDGDASLSGPDRAARIARDVLPPLHELLADATTYAPSSAAVSRAHNAWVAALRNAVNAFEHFTVAFGTDDPAEMKRARAARTREQRYRQAWLEQVAQLGTG